MDMVSTAGEHSAMAHSHHYGFACERIDAAPIAAIQRVISGGNNLILANAASRSSEDRLEVPAHPGLSHGDGDPAGTRRRRGRVGNGDGSGTGQTPPRVKKGFLKPLAPIVIPTVFVCFAAVAKNHLEPAVFNATSVWIMGATNDALDLRRRVQIQDVSMEPSFEPTIPVYGNLSLADVFHAGANTEHR
jgi:hypothetical protein